MKPYEFNLLYSLKLRGLWYEIKVIEGEVIPLPMASLLFTQSIMNKVPSCFSRTNLQCGHFLFCVCLINQVDCHHQSRSSCVYCCVSSLSSAAGNYIALICRSGICFSFKSRNNEGMWKKKTCQCPRICRNFMNLFFIHFLCSYYFLTLGEIR